MKALLVSPLGVLIGVTIGAFGGGGSLIAVPILVYLAGQDVREAQASALVIIGAAALAGLVTGTRAGELRWRAGLTFGAAAAAGALAGSIVSRGIQPDALLLAFSPVMIAGAWAMLRDPPEGAPTFRPWREGVRPRQVAQVLGLGLGCGALVGLFGVGGGFVIVPALILALGFKINDAITTSLLVIVMGSTLALADRIHAGDIDWSVAIPFSVAALLGSLAGRRLASNLHDSSLRTGFAWLIVAAALYTGARAVVALA